MDDFLIRQIQARRILDSSGAAGIETEVILENKLKGRASVSGGFSDSADEAVAGINEWVAPVIKGLDVRNQGQIDDTMLKLCETKPQLHLETGGMMSVSMAAAKAAAQREGKPLYRYFAEKERYRMPIPVMDLSDWDVQPVMSGEMSKCMLMPIRAVSFRDALQMEMKAYHNLQGLLQEGRKADFVDAVQRMGDVSGQDVVLTTDTGTQKMVDGRTIKRISVSETGTLTEAFGAIMLAQKMGYGVGLLDCLGETEETTVADIAVAMGVEQVIFRIPWSQTQIARYNRLLWIEEQLGKDGIYENPFF